MAADYLSFDEEDVFNEGDIIMEEDYIIEDDNIDVEYDLTSDNDLADSDKTSELISVNNSPDEKLTWQEQRDMIQLRAHLNQLAEKVKLNQISVDKTREEIKKCNNHLRHLEATRDDLFRQIEEAESSNNIPAIYRLRAAHDKTCREIEGEEAVIDKLKKLLEQAEFDFAKADVAYGKYILLEEELVHKEQQLQHEKTELAMQRIQQEENLAQGYILSHEKHLRKKVAALKEEDERHRKAIKNAKQSHQRAAKYLKATLEKMRKEKENETAQQKESHQRKMKMLLKLKNAIVTNRENLWSLHSRDKLKQKIEMQKENEVRQSIIDRGGNPDEALLIKKRLDAYEVQKQEFAIKQREEHTKIVAKILVEEQRLEQRKKQQRYLFVDARNDKEKIVKPLPKKPLKIMEQFLPASGEKSVLETSRQNITEGSIKSRETFADEGENVILSVADSSDSDLDAEREDSTNLAEPEFEGLWDQHKPYQVPKDSLAELKLPGASKMQKEIMSRVLDKQRQSIVVKQVAAGKQFEGCAFYSKPRVIHFKDLEVGQCYKRKVTLTNASYSVNYCKYKGLTERLKDFITIDFDPPGQISAGLTCEMLVTFKPMINVDLEGEVYFLAQTGPFSVPLKCTTKKCNLYVNTTVVNFGQSVIGETLKRSVVLTNNGALGTVFNFTKMTDLVPRNLMTGEESRLVTDIESNDTEAKSKTEESRKPLAESHGVPEAIPESPGNDEPALSADLVASSLTEPKLDGDTELVTSEETLQTAIEDITALDGMKVGPLAQGSIGPYSSTKLEIVWQPTIPGKVDSKFIITFEDILSKDITIQALGFATDFPVWVERQTVDLNICMFDRLYQDTVIICSRATSAIRLKFEVCQELRNHMELLPKTGFIQAMSKFSAQLRFLPRKSLCEEASKFFDKETGVLEVPITIHVADQAAPVIFTAHAVVTNSDMEFDVASINFGYCTVFESVTTTIKLTNKSLLPQKYGFIGLPDYVEVQPNDGFGTILPLETMEQIVVFSPKKAAEYQFQLICKTLVNREFRVSGTGIGVMPPLELSHQVVSFAATALYDVSSATISIINNHSNLNEFSHPVPRIGKGPVAPVGPTTFELVVPENSPLTASPTVGTVLPNNRTQISIHFTPKLNEKDIRQEAVRMATILLQIKAEKDYQEALKKEKEAAELAELAGISGKKGAKAGKTSPKGSKGKPSNVFVPSSQGTSIVKKMSIVPPTAESIEKDSPPYNAAIGSLMRKFEGSFETYTIPCYVASGCCGIPGELNYSIHNTLYLEVRCPAVRPSLVIISNHGSSVIDFGEVSIGLNTTRSVSLHNISNEKMDLHASLLDTAGPFIVLNAFRPLNPGYSHTCIISFTPTSGKKFQEELAIKSQLATLHLKLKGKGVSPDVTLSLDSRELVMGPILAGEYCERTFKIFNTSSLPIEYAIKLDSQSLLRYSKAQSLPSFVSKQEKRHYVGTQNNNGQSVFDLVPASGTLPAGGSKDITVTFSPDHQSKLYSDGVHIELFDLEESHFFQLLGTAYSSVVYLDGYDEILPDVESLGIVGTELVQEEEAGGKAKKKGDDADKKKKNDKTASSSVLLTLKCNSYAGDISPVPREIFACSVKTTAGLKKNGEFIFESTQAINAKGFTLDPIKGTVEPGSKKPITFSWMPPPNYDTNKLAEASILVTLKGDVVEQVRILLRAMLVTVVES